MPRQKSTHVDSPEAVGRRIREARKRTGLKQNELAFPGCTAAYISRIEAGARIPSLQLLRELGRKLGVSADYLAQGDEAAAAPLALADARLAARLGDDEAARTRFGELVDSDDPELRRPALLGLARLALADGDLDRATALLEEVEQLGPAGQIDAEAAEALANAYAARGDRPRAIALLEQKLALPQIHVVARFRLTVALADLLVDLGELDRAEATVVAALSALGDATDPVGLARNLWSHSRDQAARGSSELALRYARDALSLIEATDHERYAARAGHLVAFIELDRGNAGRALEVLDEATPLVERVGDGPLSAQYRLERARALAALGELDEARSLASDLALDVQRLGRADAARALGILGDVFTRTGDTQRALALYETAVEAAGELEHAPMLVGLYTRWSDLLAETGDTERALEVARRALDARSGAAARQ